jgi:hypothetical protein
MLSLILFLVTGSVLVYISRFNFQLVAVNLGFYTLYNIPLFYVIIGSLLAGLILSYFSYLVSTLAHALILRSKNDEIKRNRLEIEALTKQLHILNSKQENVKVVAVEK